MTDAAPLRYGLLTDSTNWRRTWSGTVNRMALALEEAGHGVEPLPPVLPRLTAALRLVGKLQRHGLKRDSGLERTRPVARLKAWLLSRSLAARDDLDALLAPVGSTFLPYFHTDLPVIYVSDATLPLMSGYYDRYAHFPEDTLRRGTELERQALSVSDLVVYPTRWAAASAERDLGVSPDAIVVAPFGPNLRDLPDRAELERLRAARPEGPPRLLFCAVEWARKGGDILLDAMRALAARGVEAELTILGIVPPAGTELPESVTVVPYLDKRIPEEAAQMRALFGQADLFVLPTRAECFGVVFCEAAAYGTPSLATRTGGIPEVVRDGETGALVAPEADGEAWADALAALLSDRARLAEMGAAARLDYETRLNWETWAETVAARTRPLCAARATS